MTVARRHTVLVTSRLARAELELASAREGAHGRQIMSPAQAAARLAGGFWQPVDRDALLDALRETLADAAVDIGDLAAVRDLPGTPRAAARALQRAWTAGLDLAVLAAETGNPRLAHMAALETGVQRRLPPSMLRPAELLRRALDRVELAPRVLGPVALRGVPDLDPVWRPLLARLAEVIPVNWDLGQFDSPGWLADTEVVTTQAEARSPAVVRVSCANPRHEALESLRWARALIAGGDARPEQIAIAAPATQDWDEHLAVIAADANLPLAFLHGRPALATREGQAAAALADLLLAGLGQARVRRLIGLVRGMTAITRTLPPDWHRILPSDAPLLDVERWEQIIAGVEEWPGGVPFGDTLLAIVGSLARGTAAAGEIGKQFLSGRALSVWRRALREGPAGALEVTLASVRLDESNDPCTSIVWCSAADVAAWPREHVRLLGLTSRGWPRSQAEDPLLPAHVLDSDVLDPVPVAERDRRDFRTVLRASGSQVVLSRSRRDGEGRQTGESALPRQAGFGDERRLRRERTPEHAVSEADRLLARPGEFSQSVRATQSVACWHDWHRAELTAHDGLVRAGHPVVARALEQRFSATRLRRLARDPLGFVWQYVLGWKAPQEDEEPLGLDALAFGSLLHRVLELAVRNPTLAEAIPGADASVVGTAVAAAIEQARTEFEAQSPVPPRLMWRRTLDEAHTLAVTALTWDEPRLPAQRCYSEVPFGDAEAIEEGDCPWDPAAPVTIPGTAIAIGGCIDRIDIAGDGSVVRVTDYKSGKPPKGEIKVAGGGELQRCLYGFAARSLLGTDAAVEARLLYPRDGGRLLALEDADTTLAAVSRYLVAAREHVGSGLALVGPGSGERDDDPLTFALPANAKPMYLATKRPLAAERLAPLPELWELP